MHAYSMCTTVVLDTRFAISILIELYKGDWLSSPSAAMNSQSFREETLVSINLGKKPWFQLT